jgi:hypothetical protein
MRERLQPAEEAGEEGEEQGVDGIPACARGCAIRFRGLVQGGQQLGEGGWMRCHCRQCG